MPITNEEIFNAWEQAIDAANQSNVKAQEFNMLLARAMLERKIPPGYTIDPTNGLVKRTTHA